jgi:hypothetical protein
MTKYESNPYTIRDGAIVGGFAKTYDFIYRSTNFLQATWFGRGTLRNTLLVGCHSG